MARCPRCNGTARPTAKEWNYAAFHVKQYQCEKCGKKYMEYYREGKISHTIPKAKK